MPTFSEALRDQLQNWGGDLQSVTLEEVAAMVRAAQVETLRGAMRTRITLEGTPESVRRVAALLHDIVQVINESADQPDPGRGFVIRQLMLEGVKASPASATRPSLKPVSDSTEAPAGRSGPADSSAGLLRAMLISLAQGLLNFPTDAEGRRQFNTMYPEQFKAGLGQLSAYLLLNGLIVSDALEYWRLLSKPLRDWPGMPVEYHFNETLIDHDGRTTPLTDQIAQGDF
jgi:hypothetical protein